jgi:hypothetical protein
VRKQQRADPVATKSKIYINEQARPAKKITLSSKIEQKSKIIIKTHQPLDIERGGDVIDSGYRILQSQESDPSSRLASAKPKKEHYQAKKSTVVSGVVSG